MPKQKDEEVSKAREVGLSQLQFQVLQLVANGLSNKQIAKQLNYSEKTIEKMLGTTDSYYSIYLKIGATNRSDAIKWFLDKEHASALRIQLTESIIAERQHWIELLGDEKFLSYYHSNTVLVMLSKFSWNRYKEFEARLIARGGMSLMIRFRKKELTSTEAYRRWLQHLLIDYTVYRIRNEEHERITEKFLSSFQAEEIDLASVSKELNLPENLMLQTEMLSDITIYTSTPKSPPPKSFRSLFGLLLSYTDVGLLSTCGEIMRIITSIISPTKASSDQTTSRNKYEQHFVWLLTDTCPWHDF
jgi:DNA-binding CsgD family transcriptional regulator